MKYTAKFFKDNLPDWKRKKDSILVRYFFRPLSFFTAALCANLKINANTVSIFSIMISIVAAGFFTGQNSVFHIIGSVLIAFWMLLDCTDGNLARSYKKQAYGEFVDSCSSYCLIAFLFICIGVGVCFTGGLFVASGAWYVVLIGGFASMSDSLARLVFQKFKSNSSDYYTPTENKELTVGKLRKLQDRIDKEIGLNGIFIPFILVCSIFGWLDLFLFIYAAYYIFELIVTLIYFIMRTVKFNKERESSFLEEKEND